MLSSNSLSANYTWTQPLSSRAVITFFGRSRNHRFRMEKFKELLLEDRLYYRNPAFRGEKAEHDPTEEIQMPLDSKNYKLSRYRSEGSRSQFSKRRERFNFLSSLLSRPFTELRSLPGFITCFETLTTCRWHIKQQSLAESTDRLGKPKGHWSLLPFTL